MNELDIEIRSARSRLVTLVEIVRWLWVVNAVVLALGVAYGNREVSALAAFTLTLALVAAGVARRACSYLRAAVRAIRST